jgi:hypothetical protein
MVPMPPPSSKGSTTATANGPTGSTAAAAAAPAGSSDQAAAAGGGSNGGDGSSGSSDEDGGFLPLQVAELASPAEMAAGSAPSMPLQQVQVRLAGLRGWGGVGEWVLLLQLCASVGGAVPISALTAHDTCSCK